jgi:SAM-dependent methyltransferase
MDAVFADVSDLPFPDRSFTHVIMRRLFGQYTLSGSGSSTEEKTWKGIDEMFRVLKEGGEIVVSEEDTPASHDRLTESLCSAGFVAINSYDSGDFRDPDWRDQRGRFWGLRDMWDHDASGGFQPAIITSYKSLQGLRTEYPGVDHIHPYLVTAKVPETIAPIPDSASSERIA